MHDASETTSGTRTAAVAWGTTVTNLTALCHLVTRITYATCTSTWTCIRLRPQEEAVRIATGSF